MIDVKEKLLQRMQEPISDYTDFVLHMASFGEIERLNKALKLEQDRSGRVGTHSPGCWKWGHQHYRCAMEHIAGLDKELESAALIVGEVRKEMVEMNERIRQLKVEAGYD
jgi:hypothetical protein